MMTMDQIAACWKVGVLQRRDADCGSLSSEEIFEVFSDSALITAHYLAWPPAATPSMDVSG